MSIEVIDSRGKNQILTDGSVRGTSFVSKKVDAHLELLFKELIVADTERSRVLVKTIFKLHPFTTNSFTRTIQGYRGEGNSILDALLLNPNFASGSPSGHALALAISGVSDGAIVEHVKEQWNSIVNSVIGYDSPISKMTIKDLKDLENMDDAVKKSTKQIRLVISNHHSEYIKALSSEKEGLGKRVSKLLEKELETFTGQFLAMDKFISSQLKPILEEGKPLTSRRLTASMTKHQSDFGVSLPWDFTYLFRETTRAYDIRAKEAKKEEATRKEGQAPREVTTSRIMSAKTAAEALAGEAKYMGLSISKEETIRLLDLVSSDWKAQRQLMSSILNNRGKEGVLHLFACNPKKVWHLSSDSYESRVREILTEEVFRLGLEKEVFDTAEDNEWKSGRYRKESLPTISSKNVLKIASKISGQDNLSGVIHSLISIVNDPTSSAEADSLLEKKSLRDKTSAFSDEGSGKRLMQTEYKETIEKAENLLREALFKFDLTQDRAKDTVESLFYEASKEKLSSKILKSFAKKFKTIDPRWIRFLDSTTLSPEELKNDPKTASEEMLTALNDGDFGRADALAEPSFSKRSSQWSSRDNFASENTLKKIVLHKNLAKDKNLLIKVLDLASSYNIQFSTLWTDSNSFYSGSDNSLAPSQWSDMPESISKLYEGAYGPLNASNKNLKEDLKKLGKMRESLSGFRSSEGSDIPSGVNADPTVFSRVLQILQASGLEGEELKHALWNIMDKRDYMLVDWLERNGGVEVYQFRQILSYVEKDGRAILPGPWKRYLVKLIDDGFPQLMTPRNLQTYCELKGDEAYGEKFPQIAIQVASRVIDSGARGIGRDGRGAEMRMVLTAIGKSAEASRRAVFELNWTPKLAPLAAELLHPMIIIDSRARDILRKAASANKPQLSLLETTLKNRGNELGSTRMVEEVNKNEVVNNARRPISIVEKINANVSEFISNLSDDTLASFLSLTQEELNSLFNQSFDEFQVLALAGKAKNFKNAKTLSAAIISSTTRYGNKTEAMMIAAAYLLGDSKLAGRIASSYGSDLGMKSALAANLPLVAEGGKDMEHALKEIKTNWSRSLDEIADSIASGGSCSEIEIKRLFKPDSLGIEGLSSDLNDLAYVFRRSNPTEIYNLLRMGELHGVSFKKEAEEALNLIQNNRYYRDSDEDKSERGQAINMLRLAAEGNSAEDCLQAKIPAKLSFIGRK